MLVRNGGQQATFRDATKFRRCLIRLTPSMNGGALASRKSLIVLKSIETSSSRSPDYGEAGEVGVESSRKPFDLNGNNRELGVITQLKKVYDFLCC
jgi:hypothetical protein